MELIQETTDETKKNNIKNKEVLSPTYELSEKTFYERNIAKQIAKKFVEFAQIGIADNLTIVGQKSTGKTAVTKLLAKEVSKESRAEEEYQNTDYIYIDGGDKQSYYQVASTLSNTKGKSVSKHMDDFKEQLGESDNQHIIIIDEADKIRNHEKLLHNLSRCKNDILIINITNDYKEFKKSLPSDTKSSLLSTLKQFPEYSIEDITKILRKRAEVAFQEYDLGTIRLIASNIKKYCGGDIRIGLKAMKKTFKSIPVLEAPDEKEKIIEIVRDEALKTQKKEIMGLEDQKIYILWALERFHDENDNKPVRNTVLSDEFMKIEEFSNSKRTVNRKMDELERKGLVRTKKAQDKNNQYQKYIKSNLEDGLLETLEEMKPDVHTRDEFFDHETKSSDEISLPHRQ